MVNVILLTAIGESTEDECGWSLLLASQGGVGEVPLPGEVVVGAAVAAADTTEMDTTEMATGKEDLGLFTDNITSLHAG